ncbi:MAG: hypothetical protein Q8872_01275 [Candidatus Phytoplasma australasiaticum]|nr:hypothetical protein [Candidatus Phytoplasma australasiaticum]
MAIIIKKTCQNGNQYFYYSNGKIKTITKDGQIKWKTKYLFRRRKKKTNLSLKGVKNKDDKADEGSSC